MQKIEEKKLNRTENHPIKQQQKMVIISVVHL